ncbi:MAG: glycosyltransferase [Bacteroidota bacterium]|jgi:GT2 family glycosyltransferase|nr:glycosyltransferase [Bacteroidota bacterium]
MSISSRPEGAAHNRSPDFSRITAGILSFNRKEDLRRTLTAVLAIPGLRVLVIDNASTDGTREMLIHDFRMNISDLTPASPDVRPGLGYAAPSGRESDTAANLEDATPSGREGDTAANLEDATPAGLMCLERNIGIAARNIFFEVVETEFLLTLDDDSWPRSGEDVARMLAGMDGDERVASVCASCVHPDTGVAETQGIERFASGGNAASGYDVVNIAAGGTLLRMAAVRQTHGYGAEFFWGREENDLAFQLLQHGWRVTYDPRAVVWHALSPAGRQKYDRLRFVTRNSLWLLWKYFPLSAAVPVSLLYAVRRMLPIVKDPRRTGAVLGGLAEGYGGLRARRRLPENTRRFTLRESWFHRGWFLKLLYE